MDNNSILDKVIATAKKKELHSFDLAALLRNLLSTLSERERDIVCLRYGIFRPQRYTLEFIGSKYSITRERVRQIEVNSVAQLQSLLKERDDVATVFDVIEVILQDLGGVTTHENLIKTIQEQVASETSEAEVDFLITKLLSDNLVPIRKTEELQNGWSLPEFNLNFLLSFLEEVEKIVKNEGKVMSLDELWQGFIQSQFYQHHHQQITKDKFFSYLQMSRRLRANPFGYWGLTKWPLVKPRRMNDKIFLVLKHYGKPLHFRQIAKKINEVGFDSKQAHPATVHNELISDSKRYVLVGRGIYALKEWGYKPGVVADIIVEILKEADRPLSKEEIITQVKKQRIVKDATIILALVDKDKFKRLPDGKYILNSEA